MSPMPSARLTRWRGVDKRRQRTAACLLPYTFAGRDGDGAAAATGDDDSGAWQATTTRLRFVNGAAR